MPIVNLQILSGRSADVKALACREITDALVRSLGVPRGSIRVLISEVLPEHWCVGGVTKAQEAIQTQGAKPA